jgi:putative DNA primase/helicase
MRPSPLSIARALAQNTQYLATPISDDGRGVNLYRYADGVFSSDGLSYARCVAFDLFGASVSLSRIEAALKLLPEIAAVHSDEVNKDARELVNVQNGMLRWSTGELLQHDPKYRSINQIPVPWDPNAKSEKLDEFLNAVIPPDALQTIEEFVGYSLIPDTSLAKCLVLVGDGGNGKSAFLTLVEALLGRENVSNLPIYALVEERSSAALLFGKLANIYDILESRGLKHAGRFERIVAGDPIRAEKKYHAPFAFRPYAKHIFTANEKPREAGLSRAFLDRLILVEFKNRIRGTSAEVLDYGRVLAETPGVLPALLVRAVNGLRRLKARGAFELPKSSLDALDDYQRECDSGIDFVREHCERAEAGRIAKASLYEIYKRWCEAEGRKTQSAREFNRAVQQAMGTKEVRRDGIRVWEGIRWKNNGEPPRAGIDGGVSVAAS